MLSRYRRRARLIVFDGWWILRFRARRGDTTDDCTEVYEKLVYADITSGIQESSS